LSYKEQRELDAMPEKIQRLEAEQLELQAALADPTLFQGNQERGAAALERLRSLAAEIESAYARWDVLES
jgi:ATP-binding cassette subfamily F protein uup